MKLRNILLVALLGSVILAACAGPAQVEEPTAGSPDNPVTSPANPEPGDPSAAPWEPRPGDEKLDRGEAFVQASDILVLESFPPQYVLNLEGALPTPCHELRVDVSEPDADNRILVEVYSVVDPEQVCIQILEPFTANVPLGSFPDGSYTLWLNGEQISEFTSP